MNNLNHIEEIKYISSQVSGWLKYLESKNIAFFAFLTGILTFVITFKGEQVLSNDYWLFFCVGIIIALLIMLYSYLPRVKQHTSNTKLVNYTPKSVVFFGEIAKVSKNDYTLFLIKTLCPDNPEIIISEYENMIISDIWENSRIAVLKSRCFKWSLNAFICGLIFSIVSYAVLLISGVT